MGILDEYETIARRHDLERKNTGGFVTLGEARAIKDPRKQFELALRLVPEDLRDQTKAFFEGAIEVCESPIEKLLLPWILCQEYSFFPHVPVVLLPGESGKLQPHSVALVPQLPIGKHRVDFALASSRGGIIRFVVIECDGEEFHEDVVRDIDRDAALLRHRQVLDIIPLSGKKIWRDPRSAAKDVAEGFSWAWSKNNKSVAWKFS
jgi:very-short-patch-repair endonuclease